MNKYIINCETDHINITPYALAKISEAFYFASKNYQASEIFTFNYFLYCASIEIGLKSAILSKDNSFENKKTVKQNIRHDLIKAIGKFEQYFNGQTIINSKDCESIKKINNFYKEKGLEYFTIDVITSAVNGGKGFPELSEIENISKKIVNFIKENKYWNDA